jgi:thiol-disulfide isomerase/thioredoxin
MNRSPIGWCSAWLLTFAILLIAPRALLSAADETADLLPRDPAAWLNSAPLTADSLQGKAAFLWFFEEQCPKCRGKWPSMYELARQYTGQPIVFIAVNSGNSSAEVEQYAREVKLTWPIIVDPGRQFEKRWLDQPISLQNIHQVGLLLPSGRKRGGSWSDLDGSVKTALQGAAWKIDPKTIPPIFMPTWQQVELGNYSAAANLLKKGLVTKNAEVKAAAERVNDFVQSEIRSAAEQAAKAREEGDAWRAYQRYVGLSRTFAGYDLPAELAAAQKELANDPKVKRELEAAKLLDGIQKSALTARTESARKRVATRLEQLTSQFADTQAAKDARQFMDRAAQQ